MTTDLHKREGKGVMLCAYHCSLCGKQVGDGPAVFQREPFRMLCEKCWSHGWMARILAKALERLLDAAGADDFECYCKLNRANGDMKPCAICEATAALVRFQMEDAK